MTASDIAARTPEAIGSRRFRLTTKNVRAFLHNEPERGNPVLVPVSHLFWSLLCRPGKAGEGVPVPNVRFAPLESLSLRQIHAAPVRLAGDRSLLDGSAAVNSRTSIKCFRLLLDSQPKRIRAPFGCWF